MGKDALNIIGYASMQSFHNSITGRPFITMKITTLIAALAWLGTALETFLGVPIAVFVAFLILNAVEFISGLAASIYRGGVWQSNLTFRAFFKAAIYVMVLGALNIFKRFEGEGAMWYLFAWTYWFLFSGISLVLVRSIFENLHKLEVKEAQIIYQILDNKYTRFLKEIAAPPSQEKNNR